MLRVDLHGYGTSLVPETPGATGAVLTPGPLGPAAVTPPGAEGLIFLPYLAGERTPHADPHARAAWIGLSLRHGRSHLVRSTGRM
jgi:hypothetical protein